MSGLKKMIQMRGGLSSIQEPLRMKILRYCDTTLITSPLSARLIRATEPTLMARSILFRQPIYLASKNIILSSVRW